MERRTLVLTSLAVVLAACGDASDQKSEAAVGTQAGAGPQVVTIVGTDYAFLQVPDTLPPGQTRFVLRNDGRVRHEMSIVLLRPGVAIRQALDVARSRGDVSQTLEDDHGLLVADPGAVSSDTLSVNLLPGRTYGLACFLKDAPTSPEHIMLGMGSGFHVR